MPTARTFDYLRLDRTHIAVPLNEAVRSEMAHRGSRRVALVTSGMLSRSTPVVDAHVMAHNLPAIASAQRLIADALGRPDQPAHAAVGELIAT